MPQYFTLQEANDKLPELTRLLQEMQEQGRQLAAIRERTGAVQRKIRGNGYHNPIEDAPLAQGERLLEESLREGIERLAEWGIELKDLERGLVDFPALREGRTVYLCWELGEPEVAYWHETTTGFAGRQPVDDEFR